MVYQLEKKYFPDQCLDKAFLDPRESNQGKDVERKARRRKNKGEEDDEPGGIKGNVGGEKGDRDEGLIFFDELTGESERKGTDAGRGGDDKEISEKRVEEFFKCLKKVLGKNGEVGQVGEVGEVGEVEPFLASRSTGLPPRWDSAAGTVVLVNKPKGWTSFTVCGKLRRLVKEKKVGHAGTLDPMATGLLIVYVGKGY